MCVERERVNKKWTVHCTDRKLHPQLGGVSKAREDAQISLQLID